MPIYTKQQLEARYDGKPAVMGDMVLGAGNARLAPRAALPPAVATIAIHNQKTTIKDHGASFLKISRSRARVAMKHLVGDYGNADD